MSIKPSELLPSVHAYLSTRYPKAAKALQKEALLAAPARDAVVPLEAAAAAWSRRQARRGLDGAADLPRAVHSFLADCKLERAAKALRKEGRLRGAASPAAPLLEMARLHARRAARGGAQIRLRATPRAVWAHPTHWLLRTQARRAARLHVAVLVPLVEHVHGLRVVGLRPGHQGLVAHLALDSVSDGAKHDHQTHEARDGDVMGIDHR